MTIALPWWFCAAYFGTHVLSQVMLFRDAWRWKRIAADFERANDLRRRATLDEHQNVIPIAMTQQQIDELYQVAHQPPSFESMPGGP